VTAEEGRPFRRVVVGIAAAVLVGAGFAASGGAALAGDGPGAIGSPGAPGEDATCTHRYPPPSDVSFCNAVGQDGDDGAAGVQR